MLLFFGSVCSKSLSLRRKEAKSSLHRPLCFPALPGSAELVVAAHRMLCVAERVSCSVKPFTLPLGSFSVLVQSLDNGHVEVVAHPSSFPFLVDDKDSVKA